MTVYFVERDGFVKIGYTANLNRRLDALGRGGSFAEGMTVGPVYLLAHIDGDEVLEKSLHRRFGADRIAGSEWFYPSDDLKRYLCGLLTGWCQDCWKWVQPTSCGLALVNGEGLIPIHVAQAKGSSYLVCDCQICPFCDEEVDGWSDEQVDADALLERLPMLAASEVRHQLEEAGARQRQEIADYEAAQEALCAAVSARLGVPR